MRFRKGQGEEQNAQEEVIVGKSDLDLLVAGHSTDDPAPSRVVLHLLQPWFKRSLSAPEVSSGIEEERSPRGVNDDFVRVLDGLVVAVSSGSEVNAVAKEGERRNAADGPLAEARDRLPGEGLDRLIEDEEDVLVRVGRASGVSMKLFECGANVDDDLGERGVSEGGERESRSAETHLIHVRLIARYGDARKLERLHHEVEQILEILLARRGW